MAETPSSISVAELRAGMSDVLNRASYGHERIGITRRGKVQAVIIGLEDFELLEQLEDREDLAAIRNARAEDDGGRISLDELLAENGITR